MLNGKRYDATTGEQVADNHVSQKTSHKASPVKTESLHNKQPKVVDGFTKRKTPNIVANKSSRKPEKSKTLMRSAVTRPAAPNITKQKKTSPRSKTIVNPSAHVNPVRELRASQTKKSKLISKFGDVRSKVKFAPVAVAQPPEFDNSSQNHSASPQQSTVHNQPNRFSNALESANSHNQPKAKRQNKRAKLARKLRVSPKLLNVSMVLAVGVLIGGYVAFNNVPNLAMQIAATRSGVDASMPEYQPSGFAVKGPIEYKPGQISITFNSNSDQRSYTVNQSKSEWNSESLLENHVAINNRSYQTFQDKGKTIYLYDGDNASWVDEGIWYEIDGNSALNSDQIIRIANSL